MHLQLQVPQEVAIDLSECYYVVVVPVVVEVVDVRCVVVVVELDLFVWELPLMRKQRKLDNLDLQIIFFLGKKNDPNFPLCVKLFSSWKNFKEK